MALWRGGGVLVLPSELAAGTILDSGMSIAEPQDKPSLDGILRRATKFGHARVFLPESLLITSVNGTGMGRLKASAALMNPRGWGSQLAGKLHTAVDPP